jgi:hypothetical protein
VNGVLLDELLVPGIYGLAHRGEQAVYPFADDQHVWPLDIMGIR